MEIFYKLDTHHCNRKIGQTYSKETTSSFCKVYSSICHRLINTQSLFKPVGLSNGCNVRIHKIQQKGQKTTCMDVPSTSDNVATLSINAVKNGRATTAPFNVCFTKSPNFYFQTNSLNRSEMRQENLDLPWENVVVRKKNQIDLKQKIPLFLQFE